MSNLLFQSGEKVLFIGDSITDCGRRGDHAPLGNGYVKKVTELITAKYPERRIEYVNKGIGGDVVEGLEARWDTDVIAEKPDWLSVKIGINNASRQLGAGIPNETYLPEWESVLSAYPYSCEGLNWAQGLFIFETFYIEEDVPQPRPLDVDAYNEIIHRLADEFNARLIRTNEAFDRAVAARPGALWTTQDGVHPNPEGHTLMALEFLKQAGW